MQDAERLQEQVDEMVTKAEARMDVAEAHHELVAERLRAAARELAKFKFLHEVFTLGENLLGQRKDMLLKGENPPEAHVVEGLGGALAELGRISRQAQDAAVRNEGSQSALQSLEEAFRQEKVQATSRARGLAVQGQKAVDVAAGRTGVPADENPAAPEPTTEPTTEGVPGFLDSLERIEEAEESAKEPIASP